MAIRMNPELMVIGDSLAQGCRSLSVTAKMCAESYGARLAGERGWEFEAPDHPRPVLWDLEAEIRRLILPLGPPLGALNAVRRVMKNIQDWDSDFHSGQQLSRAKVDCFDNLAVTGAVVPDLMDRTYESSTAEVRAAVSGGLVKGVVPKSFGGMANLHVPINAAFVLNPSQNPKYAKFSALDWVRKREPRRLIVQIGHNHGLFAAGFSGSPDPLTFRQLTRYREMARKLAELPASVEEIYVYLLPKVSAVANLMPSGVPAEGYAASYRPVFNPAGKRITGEDLKALDGNIREINNRIRETLESECARISKSLFKRVTVVDAYRLLDRYDFKNNGAASAIIEAGDKKITNFYLDGRYLMSRPTPKTPPMAIGTTLDEGGFQSCDGMHPSGVGYAVMACELMESSMGFAVNRKPILARALKDDKLLSGYPMELDGALSLIAAWQGATGRGESLPPEEKANFANFTAMALKPFC